MLDHYYLLIKQFHIGLALLSVSLFIFRFLLLWLKKWPKKRLNPFNRLSYILDTGLLLAAFCLLYILQLNPFTTAWVASKLILLVVYVGLGILAFKSQQQKIKIMAALLALLCFYLIYKSARLHLPFAGLL
ncbi:SirB2 family protein [Pseudomonas sp. F1_0610]|uniref:SirB2 family protein n=1 Tax=Pseudomonas sp. F1_0610 TaxID=3114284 RepID=UPI0039C0AD13